MFRAAAGTFVGCPCGYVRRHTGGFSQPDFDPVRQGAQRPTRLGTWKHYVEAVAGGKPDQDKTVRQCLQLLGFRRVTSMHSALVMREPLLTLIFGDV